MKVIILLGIFMLSSLPIDKNIDKIGIASWYGEECDEKITASGEVFNAKKLTCAMRNRNFGKYYEVCNLENNKCIIVEHNDWGASEKYPNRVVDLSKGAFQKIGNLDKGLIWVSVKEVKLCY